MNDEPDSRTEDEPDIGEVWWEVERALCDGTLAVDQLQAAFTSGEPIPEHLRIALDAQLTQPFLDRTERSGQRVAAARAYTNHTRKGVRWLDAIADAVERGKADGVKKISDSTVARAYRDLRLTKKLRRK